LNAFDFFLDDRTTTSDDSASFFVMVDKVCSSESRVELVEFPEEAAVEEERNEWCSVFCFFAAAADAVDGELELSGFVVVVAVAFFVAFVEMDGADDDTSVAVRFRLPISDSRESGACFPLSAMPFLFVECEESLATVALFKGVLDDGAGDTFSVSTALSL
jgi:hypothetical protein